jgi:hypothetical protein
LVIILETIVIRIGGNLGQYEVAYGKKKKNSQITPQDNHCGRNLNTGPKILSNQGFLH